MFYHLTYLWILPWWVVKKPRFSILHFTAKVEWVTVKEDIRLTKGLWSKKSGHHEDAEKSFLHPSCQIMVQSPLLYNEIKSVTRVFLKPPALKLSSLEFYVHSRTRPLSLHLNCRASMGCELCSHSPCIICVEGPEPAVRSCLIPRFINHLSKEPKGTRWNLRNPLYDKIMLVLQCSTGS